MVERVRWDGVRRDGVVHCMICGWPAHNLGRHLSTAHRLTGKAYQQRFPGAPLVSDHVRGVASDMITDRDLDAWSTDSIVGAIRRWHRRTGRVPAVWEWRRPLGRKFTSGDKRAARPNAVTVIRIFGSWDSAIRAAGFEPRGNHRGPSRRTRKR